MTRDLRLARPQRVPVRLGLDRITGGDREVLRPDLEPHELIGEAAQPRIGPRVAQAHVGRAARRRQHRDVGQRRLELGGDDAGDHRDVVGHGPTAEAHRPLAVAEPQHVDVARADVLAEPGLRSIDRGVPVADHLEGLEAVELRHYSLPM